MKHFLQLTLLTLTPLIYAQSIIVNPAAAPESSLGAEALTVEVLIDGGECSAIENFQVKDNPSAQFPSQNSSWGYFEKGTSNFPFEKGIVLTSGFARRAQGPSTGIVSDGPANGWADGSAGQPMDPDATVLADWDTENTTIFEFDFVPYGTEISFNYIFASEEHPTFSCSTTFNDAFGFIISGPGIIPDPGLSGKNIATLPTGDWVTINNVNDQGCGDATYYVPGPFNDIQYGGRTVPLTAYAEVIPGETYHIRLIVTDAGDHQYDSAVFLEAGSFSLGSTLVDLEGTEIGENEILCDVEEYTLVVNLEAPDAQFQWFFNSDPIPGATGQTYTATESGYYEVEVISGTCSTIVGVEILFTYSPEAENVEDFICNTEGTHIFDLTSYEDDITQTPGAIFSYYNSLVGAENEVQLDEITNTTNFPVTGTTTVYVRVENENECYVIIELTLSVGLGPDTQPATYSQCDDNGDGVAEFDLPSYNDQIVTSGVGGLTFEYFLDADMTQMIPNPQTFNNTSNPQVIYVKTYVDSSGEETCVSTEELTLVVNEFPDIQDWTETYCDNLDDNSEFIDLTNNEIVITSGLTVTLHYYSTLGDLQTGTGEIMNPTNYEITTSPTNIYVQVESQDGNCRDYSILTITLIPSPEVQDAELENCSIDGLSSYYLPEANDLIASGNNLTFTYHTTYNNAINGQNPLPNDYNNTTPNQIIYVRVENANGCYSIAELLLTTVMVHEELNSGLEQCDDPATLNDGIAVFDLTEMDNLVENALGGTNYTIHYYLSLANAQNGTNPIPNPAEFTNTLNPQIIYARASGGDGGCAGTAEFELEVRPVPEFNLPSSLSFCAQGGDEMSYLFEGNFATYTWTDPDGNVISNSADVVFEQPGIHTLEVTQAGNLCSAIREVEVIMDQQPIITQIDVNGSTVTVFPGGASGPYEYSYNGGLTWHSHFVLTDVPPGVHYMLVRSLYGCISESKIFAVLGIPNVITPNGDGYNDYMTVRGLELYPDAHIKIFDRYGKIFIDRKMGTEFKWDGQYMGRPLPSGDYWYIITIDADKSISGHISIRNR